MTNIDRLTVAAMAYDRGDARRIQHFLKVHSLSALMGRMEGLPVQTQLILEAAALLHDIGIHSTEQKYGSTAGYYQEIEGPPIAQKLLAECGFAEETIRRVCFLIGHHHTYQGIDGIDWQLLVEADFLVNLYEENAEKAGREAAFKQIFRTSAGKQLYKCMFD